MYLETINKYKNNYNFEIITHCMMNNHAHFLIYTEDIIGFGKFMHKVNLTYASTFNKEEHRCGVLFRNRYKTEPIYDIKYLINCIKYIHDNPVKAGIVKKCEDYKYSSYNDYINHTGATKSMIMCELFGSDFDYEAMFAKLDERRFMDIDDDTAKDTNRYILACLCEFQKRKHATLVDILSNRNIFKRLIFFLNKEKGLKFVEIRLFFDVPRGAMDFLKKI